MDDDFIEISEEYSEIEDNEDEYQWESDDNEENDNDKQRIEMENQYHESKNLEEEKGIEAAIEAFSKVLIMEKELEGRNQDFSFKALKRMVKLVIKLNDQPRLIKYFRELLTYNSANNGISENDLFKGIGKILDIITTTDNMDLIFEIYDIALKQMKKCNNNLWFKTNLKLAQKLFDIRNTSKLPEILHELEESCLLPDKHEDPKKANFLLDIYALAIQLYIEQKDLKKTKEMYERGFAISKKYPGVLNSKLAIFHFVGGKLHMETGKFNDAYSSFFEAFNYFEEMGSRFKAPCLKYIVLSNMLAKIGVNPFDSPETLNMKNNQDIKPMADLLDAYQTLDINKLDNVLKLHNKKFMNDPFIYQFIPNVLSEIRTQSLLKLIKSYTKITLPSLAKQLYISSDEVKKLLVSLILEDKIKGKIDEINQTLILEQDNNTIKYRECSKWTDILESLHNSVIGKVF